jgi:hypothetical protein
MQEIARFDQLTPYPQSSLLWDGGTLYFNGESSDPNMLGIDSVPDQGGALSQFLNAGIQQMWAEDGNIVYAADDSFYSIPFAGGQAQLLADGGTCVVGGQYMGDAQAQTADSVYFYWIRDPGVDDSNYAVWAKPRTGDPSIKLGDIDTNQVGVSRKNSVRTV